MSLACSASSVEEGERSESEGFKSRFVNCCRRDGDREGERDAASRGRAGKLCVGVRFIRSIAGQPITSIKQTSDAKRRELLAKSDGV